MSSRVPFLDLPAELRFHVYGYFFEFEGTCGIARDYYPTWEPSPVWCRHLLLRDGILYSRDNWGSGSFKHLVKMLTLCKTINEEATELLFERTLFAVTVHPYNKWRQDAESPMLRPASASAILRKAQRIWIAPVLREMRTLPDLPAPLEQVLDLFDCSSDDTDVIMGMRDERALEPYHFDEDDPWEVFITPPLIRDENWDDVLNKLASLKRRARFSIEMRPTKDAGQQRFDELVRAVNGTVEVYISSDEPQTDSTPSENAALPVFERIAVGKGRSSSGLTNHRTVIWLSEKYKRAMKRERVAQRNAAREKLEPLDSDPSNALNIDPWPLVSRPLVDR